MNIRLVSVLAILVFFNSFWNTANAVVVTFCGEYYGIIRCDDEFSEYMEDDDSCGSVCDFNVPQGELPKCVKDPWWEEFAGTSQTNFVEEYNDTGGYYGDEYEYDENDGSYFVICAMKYKCSTCYQTDPTDPQSWTCWHDTFDDWKYLIQVQATGIDCEIYN